MAAPRSTCGDRVPRKKRQQAEINDTPLVPQAEFEAAFKRVLGTTKKQSDKQLAKFQASNKARRAPR